MARWPALARRVHRLGPDFWDVGLALAIAFVSLATVEADRGVVERGPPAIKLSSTPFGLRPGEPWTVEIVVTNPQLPLQEGEPRLTIVDSRTGATRTYDSTPVAEPARPEGPPGVYRLRAVFPRSGTYSFFVTGGGVEPFVRIGDTIAKPVPPPSEESQAAPLEGWAVVLALLASLPIALRRRFPVAIFAITLAAALLADIVYDSFQLLGALVALYTVAAHRGRPGSVQVAVATALALPLLKIGESGPGNIELAAVYGACAAAWLLGDNLRTRRAYLRELEDRAARLEREQEENARRAAADEQARIARDLHDIIAHNVSVMTVQAAAAGDAFETQPGKVREALGSIESTGREALTELRRLLGSVRPDDDPGTFAPQPGLARVDELIDQVRATGLAVELIVEGSPRELPPGVDLSAYRIVQEALTNTLNHAGASHATVHVRYGEGTLDIEVVDDGRGATADGTERGHGIIGMRERAALVGGELEVGRAKNGGFSIHARIPLEEPDS
jgi:signal transduction histidine kinase